MIIFKNKGTNINFIIGLKFILNDMKTNPESFLEQIHLLISNITKNIEKKKNRQTVCLDSLVLIIVEGLITKHLSFLTDMKKSNHEIIALSKDIFPKLFKEEFIHAFKDMIAANKSSHKSSFLYVFNKNVSIFIKILNKIS